MQATGVTSTAPYDHVWNDAVAVVLGGELAWARLGGCVRELPEFCSINKFPVSLELPAGGVRGTELSECSVKACDNRASELKRLPEANCGIDVLTLNGPKSHWHAANVRAGTAVRRSGP